jgi:hypothetical protein
MHNSTSQHQAVSWQVVCGAAAGAHRGYECSRQAHSHGQWGHQRKAQHTTWAAAAADDDNKVSAYQSSALHACFPVELLPQLHVPVGSYTHAA